MRMRFEKRGKLGNGRNARVRNPDAVFAVTNAGEKLSCARLLFDKCGGIFAAHRAFVPRTRRFIDRTAKARTHREKPCSETRNHVLSCASSNHGIDRAGDMSAVIDEQFKNVLDKGACLVRDIATDERFDGRAREGVFRLRDKRAVFDKYGDRIEVYDFTGRENAGLAIHRRLYIGDCITTVCGKLLNSREKLGERFRRNCSGSDERVALRARTLILACDERLGVPELHVLIKCFVDDTRDIADDGLGEFPRPHHLYNFVFIGTAKLAEIHYRLGLGITFGNREDALKRGHRKTIPAD